MERIKLSKVEKNIIRDIKNSKYPYEVKRNDYIPIRKLIHEGLIVCDESETGLLMKPKLTNKGNVYLMENPKLNNPSIFQDKSFILSISAFIISLITLLLQQCDK